MYTIDQYRALTEKYGAYSSWAIWDANDPYSTALIDQNFEQLHSRFVLLGLNISRPLPGNAWSNFHDNTHAHKLKYTCNDTNLRGCYITDIFKGIVAARTEKFERLLTDQVIKENVSFFEQEMQDIQLAQESQLIVFGTPHSLLARCFSEYFQPHFGNPVLYFYHYAYYTLTDKEWVTGFWRQLGIVQDFDATATRYRSSRNSTGRLNAAELRN